MMDDDAQLLRRYAREGEEEAFAELVRRHLGLVYGSALRRVNGNAALAEEVAQGVFAGVARDAELLAEKAVSGVALAGWIYVMTRNAAANVVRAEVRRVRREQEAFVMSELESGGADGMTGAGDAEVWAQVRPELEAVMDELREKDRDAVLLRFFEGKAFGEIGAALRVSEDAARVRVNRALEKMRGLLAKRGVTSTAAALGGLLAGNAAVAAPAGMVASVAGAVLSGGTAMVVGSGAVSVGAASAGVAGVSGMGAGILTFMTTTKLVTGVACVVAAVAVGTAVYTHRENEMLRTKSLEDSRQALLVRTELAGRLSEAESRAQEAEQRREVAQKALEVETAKPKVAVAGSTAKQAAPTVRAADVLYADPGFQQASLDKFLTSVGFNYAPFYRKIGLSAAQIAQFERALLTREQALLDKNAAARSQRMSISDPSLGKVANPGLDEAYTELQRVLGEEGMLRFNAFEKTLGVGEETRGILAASLYSEAPLTLEQSELIGEILAANRLSEKNGAVTTFTGFQWDEVAARAGAALPEAQARFVRQYAERVKAERLWQNYWRAAQTGRPLSEVSGAVKTK